MSTPHPRTTASGKAGDPWLYWPAPREHCRMRLFCFPYAGGSPGMFRLWPARLPKDVELAALRLPGRDRRISEAPFTTWEPLLAAVEEALLPHLDRPFAFFGHSLGASIAWETACRLRARGHALPAHLLLSGRRAPHRAPRVAPIHALPRPELYERLRLAYRTTAEVLANREVMELIEPMLRADFRLAETWTPAMQAPLPVPIAAFSGALDPIAPPSDVQEWALHTTLAFSVRDFPGDHFFVHSSEDELLRDLSRILVR
ncbi:MAG TPA: alpha/beta fold hydrolase [Haliangium sp.]|nr:alpha/beta fold hydrolase [Haliangium sp.]